MEALTAESENQKLIYEKGVLYPDVPFPEYCKAEGINSHGLMDIDRSPAHFYEAKFNKVEDEGSKAMQLGRLLHLAILEPKLFAERCVYEPVFEGPTKDGRMSTQSAAAREKKAQWYMNLHAEAVVVPQDQIEKLLGMAKKVTQHPRAMKLLEDGVREGTLFWDDQETGELCKGRWDFLTTKKHIVDFKTSNDARFEPFWRQIKKLHYDLQAAHYLSGAKQTKIASPDVYVFLVVENKPPYEIAIYPAGMSILAYGERKRERTMRLYAKCKKENKWPGYNPDARTIEYPDYIMEQETFENDEEEV